MEGPLGPLGPEVTTGMIDRAAYRLFEIETMGGPLDNVDEDVARMRQERWERLQLSDWATYTGDGVITNSGKRTYLSTAWSMLEAALQAPAASERLSTPPRGSRRLVHQRVCHQPVNDGGKRGD